MLVRNRPVKWWINDYKYMKIMYVKCGWRNEYTCDLHSNEHCLRITKPVVIHCREYTKKFHCMCHDVITSNVIETLWLYTANIFLGNYIVWLWAASKSIMHQCDWLVFKSCGKVHWSCSSFQRMPGKRGVWRDLSNSNKDNGADIR